VRVKTVALEQGTGAIADGNHTRSKRAECRGELARLDVKAGDCNLRAFEFLALFV
jgi:hypothetical protein